MGVGTAGAVLLAAMQPLGSTLASTRASNNSSTVLATKANSSAPPRDIYGEDDRYETYEIADKRIQRWSRSVAAMVPRKLISKDGKLRRGIRTLSLSKRNVSLTSKPRHLPVAPTVRFGAQPLYGVGTASSSRPISS